MPKNAKTTTDGVFTGDVSQATQPVNSSPESLEVWPLDAESVHSTIAEISLGELGKAIVPEIKFPEGSQWEEKLYKQKEKFAPAGRALNPPAK